MMKMLWVVAVAALVGSLAGPGSAGVAAASPTLVAFGAGAEVCNQLAWAGSDGATSQVYVANADGLSRTEISTVGSGTDPSINRDAVWSPDGSRIAWSGWDGSVRQIYVANNDGTNRVEISAVGSGPDPTENNSPVWSPDGTRIAWDSDDGDEEGRLWVADSDGTNRIEISSVGSGTDPIENQLPAWSPDGTRIAWGGDDGSTAQIFVADPDGANRIEISSVGSGPDPVNNFRPAWSPDGTRIAWGNSSGPTSGEIYVADIDGTNRTQISKVGPDPDPTNSSSPVWSPDSSRIAWQGRDGSTVQIYVADADGTNRAEVSTAGADPDPGSSFRAAWSADGTRIAWGSFATGGLYTADPDGTNRVEVSAAGSDPDPLGNGSPDWRGRDSQLGLVTTTTALNAAQGATSTATVTNSGPCSSYDVVVTGLTLPCVAAPSVSATAGSVVGSTWTIPSLAAGATATATVSGTAANGPCSSTLALAAMPATGGAVGALLGGNVCPTGATGFTDVSGSSFAAADIACIFGLGITTGTSATTYSPGDNVTREQMAAFLARLWRALGEVCPTGATGFTDVSGSSFAAADIACIFGLGITTGTSATTYSPGDNVTREQMAAFLARLWRIG
jgi:Tol biopolymer transport system component